MVIGQVCMCMHVSLFENDEDTSQNIWYKECIYFGYLQFSITSLIFTLMVYITLHIQWDLVYLNPKDPEHL